MSDVHLIRPLNPGKILTEDELRREDDAVEAERWRSFVEYVMIPPLDQAHVASQLVELTGQAEDTLANLQKHVEEQQVRHAKDYIERND